MAQQVAASSHAVFRKALPYEIMPTRLPGVYVSPALPEDFNPKEADTKRFWSQSSW